MGILHHSQRISTGPEVVERMPDIIIGSWCGKKFRPGKVAEYPIDTVVHKDQPDYGRSFAARLERKLARRHDVRWLGNAAGRQCTGCRLHLGLLRHIAEYRLPNG
jgi:hypothetical protein